MSKSALQSETLPFAPMNVAHGLTIENTRDLLDWLEAHGIDNATVEIDASDRVAILLKC